MTRYWDKCSETCALFLPHPHPHQNLEPGYIEIAHMINYHFNIIWLLCVFILELVISFWNGDFISKFWGPLTLVPKYLPPFYS